MSKKPQTQTICGPEKPAVLPQSTAVELSAWESQEPSLTGKCLLVLLSIFPVPLQPSTNTSSTFKLLVTAIKRQISDPISYPHPKCSDIWLLLLLAEKLLLLAVGGDEKALADPTGAAPGAVHHLRAPLIPVVKVSVGNNDLTFCPNWNLWERCTQNVQDSPLS